MTVVTAGSTARPAVDLSADGAETVYQAADGGPPVRLIPRGYRAHASDHLTSSDAPGVQAGRWEAFGRAVLAFHRRMAATAMCVCGRTWRECDVWRQAEQYGIRRLPQ